jgi:nucleotide-binding universal stress UspA family protein
MRAFRLMGWKSEPEFAEVPDPRRAWARSWIAPSSFRRRQNETTVADVTERRSLDAPVVVGVDGSTEALLAVDVGATLAAERSRPLRIVHAFIWPELRVPLGPAPGAPSDSGLRADADRIVSAAVDRARDRLAGAAVTAQVVTGAATPVLLEEAETAALVVVGSRGLGGFSGLLVGSVAVQLAAHAACPVVVAKGQPDRAGDVVVGVDGSPKGEPAIGFAFEAASVSGARLTAVHAFQFPVHGEPGDMLPLVYDADQLAEEEAAVLGEAIAGWRERYPDVVVRSLVVRSRPTRALVSASEQARLLVVGTRGRGGFTGLLLGSVSHGVLHHAACPVAIVR